ncbi:maleylpyruvate isomerase family mycothiol-dependent enzyme [Streptosporangium sp. NBC_01755]|uniref:maleylpyruvate isomerase family mycothiol-dependent enzyme n=1 Tax=unclassified Streptosporangium TaxID=2632669 RepID=UPI002DDBF1FA|nr:MULTISPECIES: maleylpyruvate isomerase family mycothiol-dependent enzyme [unclassified Streptosporangium]WSA22992.1 maleylpyruvate isomerase family mycothiol-dependent enzyme [Streptosporangium sp. NBC_01810]WSC98865.1 maleylpyruvate isomerase family mycothiol-dependent enzyme [Streptosporangium sp. NBC_01755]
MREWTHAEHASAVAAEAARMVDVLGERDMSAPVPTCPGWDLAGLVTHIGGVHRWVAAMVRDLAERRYSRRETDTGLPADASGSPAWLAEGATLLSEALLSRDPRAPMWSWGAEQRVGFWSRRMLHETLVHRMDAELALGVPVTVDEETAADGVEEFLDVLPYARWNPGVAELRGGGETISLQADTGAGWVITLDPDRFHHRRSLRPGSVTVRTATSADLLQVVWGRRSADDYAVEGDEGLLGWWRELARV